MLALAVTVVVTTDTGVETIGDSVDACREVTGAADVPPGCGKFQNTCPSYTMESSARAFDVYQNRLPATEIAGVRYPRTARLQYRGIQSALDQFTVPKVLRAIGGYPTPTIGSRLSWLAQAVLMQPERLRASGSLLDPLRRAYRRYVFGRPTLFAHLAGVFQEHGILGDVETLLACQASYSRRDAAIYARDLSLKALRHLESEWGASFTRHLLTYNTEEFSSYGDYAGGIHFYSSLYPTMAHAYGSKVLVFSNTAGRSLDLNYWNYRNNESIWSYHDADRAEFVTAIGIDPAEVQGLWKTDESHRDRMGRDTAMHDRKLIYALMRLDLNGVHYAVILDARTTGCVIQVGAHFEGCRDPITRRWEVHNIHDASQVEFGPLIPDGRPLPAIAVVRACAVDDAACGIADEVLAELPAADRDLTIAEEREISSASFRVGGRLFVQRIRHVASPSALGG